MSAAPDYIGPIVGWRTWLVVPESDGFRLRSVVYDTLWSPRTELVARCLHRSLALPWRRRSGHVPPAPGCRCGIYAAMEPAEAASYLEGRTWSEMVSVHRVIGTVSLWGRVVECRRGWRAARAYPQAIYVPQTRGPYWLKAKQAEEIALALTDYGVPVELIGGEFRGADELAAALAEVARV